MADSEEGERILILCVDRDGDLDVKAGVKTPLLGREENLRAAIKLVLKDPEEADANAMFEAIRVFDHLSESGGPQESFEIATISGSELGGVEADRKIVKELVQVLDEFPASGVILVTDGYSDEAVLPLVESRVPVNSVRRIVIRHSESIEETAALFSRYFKLLMENPRYSRVIFGLPGFLLILLGLLSLFDLLLYYWIALLVVFGSYFFVKGFGIDRAARNFYHWIREYSPPPLPIQIVNFTVGIGLLSIGVGCYQGISHASVQLGKVSGLAEWYGIIPQLIGWFIEGSILLIVVGMCVILSGRAIRYYLERDPRVLRTVVVAVVIGWSSRIFEEASRVLINPSELFPAGLVLAIVIGILLALASLLITFILHRKYRDFFKREGEKIEEFNEG